MLKNTAMNIRNKNLKFYYGVIITGFIFVIYQLLLIMLNTNSEEATAMSILILFVLFIFSIISAYKDMNNIMLLLFYICLFNFQFSYIFFGVFLGYEYWIIPGYFGEVVYSRFTIINQVLLIIGMSIVLIHSLLIKYHFKYIKRESEYKSNYRIDSILKYVQFVSKIIIIITAPFAFMFMYKQIQYVMTNGYQSYFLTTTKDMGINVIVNQLETLFRVAIAMFFATYPKRKQLRIPLVLYICYTLLYLGVGDRTNLAVLFMMLIWYFSEYKKKYSLGLRNSRRFNLKERLKIIILGVVLLLVFSIWNEIRYGFGTGREFSVSNSNSSMIIDFLSSQGRSYNTVLKALTIDKIGILTISDRLVMLFQPLLHQLEGMSLNIFNWDILHEQGGFMFTKVPSSADLISIFTNSSIYLSGGGLGTSYLAEGILLGGYFGVLITSLIVSAIIIFASYKTKDNYWKRSFVIFSFMYIMRLPRDYTFGILAFFLPFIIRFGLIFFISIILSGVNSVAPKHSKKLVVKSD